MWLLNLNAYIWKFCRTRGIGVEEQLNLTRIGRLIVEDIEDDAEVDH